MEPSLLAAILEHPSDDFARLVLADWLEENGQADRAEFIRVQVEMAKIPPEPERCQPVLVFGRPDKYHHQNCPWCQWVENHRDRRKVLQSREHELRSLHGDTWALPLALAAGFPDTPMYGATNGRDSFGNPRYHNICSEYASDGGRRLAWTFRRGFVASIETDTKTFLAHGPALATCQPLTSVAVQGQGISHTMKREADESAEDFAARVTSWCRATTPVLA